MKCVLRVSGKDCACKQVLRTFVFTVAHILCCALHQSGADISFGDVCLGAQSFRIGIKKKAFSRNCDISEDFKKDMRKYKICI